MKQLNLCSLLFALLMGSLYSQTLYDSELVEPSGTAVAQKNSSSYIYANTNIGKEIYDSDAYKYRTWYECDLSDIPDNATITNVEVTYYADNSGSGYSFELTQLSSVPTSPQSGWSAVGSGSSLDTGLNYGSYSFDSENIETAVQNALSSNTLIIGALSEDEGTTGSTSNITTFTLDIDYSYPANALEITIQNSLEGGSGGTIGVAIYPSSAVSHSSPYSFTAYEEDRLNLAAYDNQSVSGKVWFFNDTEYGYRDSEWKKGSSFLSYSSSFATTALTTSDDNAEFIAYLRTTSYTTSGTMSSDELVWTSTTLSGDVTVADGVTLTVYSTGTITLNGHSIICEGTGKVVNNGTISGCVANVTDGSDYKGYHPSVSDALSNSSSGQTVNITWSSTLSDDLEVPSGVTLKFNGGTTTTLNSNKITTTSGSLYMNGGSVSPNIQHKNSSGIRKGFYPTIASAINASSSGEEVYLGAATYNEDVDMPGSFELSGTGSYSTVINGDVTFDGVSSSKIINMRVNGDITVDGGSAYIHFVRADDVIDIDLGSGHDVWEVYTENSGYVNLYSTESLVDDVSSYNSYSRTIHANRSEVDANDGYFQNKTSYAVYAGNYSDIVLDAIEFCGNNGGSDDKDIYCSSTSNVDASGVTYFTICPAGVAGLGTITLDTTNCTACPSAKRNAEHVDEDYTDDDLTIAEGDTEAEKLFHEALLAYRSINKKKRENRSKENQHLIKYDAEYSVAAQKMKKVLEKHSDSPFAIKALRYLDYCYRSLNRSDEFTTILDNLLKESISRQMTYAAKRLLVSDLLRRQEYADAIVLLDELINSQDDVEEKQNLICRKGIIYDKYVKDYDAATDFYSQVIDLDAESPVAWDAQQRLDRMERDYQPGASEDETAGEELEFTAHNYPNPANPGTSIQYALPEDGHVSIRIYNINGQQVAELLSADMPAGRHQVRWDGRNAVGHTAATGMYFYRVEFEGKVLSHKFLLLR